MKEIDTAGGRIIVLEFSEAGLLPLPLLLTPHDCDLLGLTDVSAGYGVSATLALPSSALRVTLRMVT